MINKKRKGRMPFFLPKIFNLKLKMLLLISLLIIGIGIIFFMFLERVISNTIEDQIGKRALSLAHSVANIPEIKEAFLTDDPSSIIQEIVLPIQKQSGAEFIVVGNKEGIRYAHPNPEAIGKKMVGGDNDRALNKGEAYESKKEGTLGLSIRGKVPIYLDGEIIGVVSVGFLNDNVQHTISDQSKSLWLTVGVIILIGITGATFITNYIKRLLINMEPEEIAHLYQQNEAILQSAHEGIIAADEGGCITAMNRSAKEILFSQESDRRKTYIGLCLKETVPSLEIKKRNTFSNREMVMGENIVLVNQTSIYNDDTFAGTVYTIRKKTELEKVTEELKRIKQYANSQRAQTHEYSNKLHIILGLVQNDHKAEVIDFIKKENNLQQERLKFLSEKVADPLIQALLQGKYNQANELGISMNIHPDSRMEHLFSETKQDAVLTALGNVIENALEAVKGISHGRKRINIFFTDIGEDCLFEVDDSGPGIEEGNVPRIFEQGFSMKAGANRGTGLALSKIAVAHVDGEILYEEGELGGASFMIVIPKGGEE